MALTEVLEDIRLSFRQLEFSIRLLTWCERGNIAPKEFDDEHIVKLEDGDLNFPAGEFADAENITRSAGIGVLLAMGASAIALNSGFDEVKLEPHPASADGITRLRTLVYMVRNAYAHDIASPQWEVRGPFLRELTVDLDNGQLSIDLSALHGTAFDVSHIGGYANWYRIRRAAVSYLETMQAPAGS